MPHYTIDHSGIDNSNNEYGPYYNRSNSTTVETNCSCNIGKTIRFYYDWFSDDKDEDKFIEKTKAEIKSEFNNKFRFCDLCEERILDSIAEEYT
jgi:hypothetical protein